MNCEMNKIALSYTKEWILFPVFFLAWNDAILLLEIMNVSYTNPNRTCKLNPGKNGIRDFHIYTWFSKIQNK